MRDRILLVAALVLWLPASAAGIALGQVDDFQDGTTQDWAIGRSNGPANIPDGGPAGTGDAFLQLAATGIDGPGGRLAVMNQVQWAGNYTAAAVTRILASVDNQGSTDLALRLGISGPGGEFVTAAPILLSAGSSWQRVAFDVGLPGWTDAGTGSDLAATLADVSVLRLLHAPQPLFGGGPLIEAALGVDDFAAVPEPGSAALLAAGLLALGRRRCR